MKKGRELGKNLRQRGSEMERGRETEGNKNKQTPRGIMREIEGRKVYMVPQWGSAGWRSREAVVGVLC